MSDSEKAMLLDWLLSKFTGIATVSNNHTRINWLPPVSISNMIGDSPLKALHNAHNCAHPPNTPREA